MRVKITDIQKSSSEYKNREVIVGRFGEFKKEDNIETEPGFTGGYFYPEDTIQFVEIYSFGFKYIEVPEPSAMSELGTLPELRFTFDHEQWQKDTQAIYDSMRYTKRLFLKKAMVKAAKEVVRAGLDVSTYEYDFTTPKKLSWLQKIRGYDSLAHELEVEIDNSNWLKENRIKVLENQVEMFSELAATNKRNANRLDYALSEALRDRDLHAKVADGWQTKLIEANKENAELIKLVDEYCVLGRRLKFSVGHNHIMITIGNPITLCENFISDKCILEWSISRCSRKDAYDWKQGAIKSLDNYCDEHKHAEKLRRDLRKALAKKYTEVFDVHP
jgi:hypothetical protein